MTRSIGRTRAVFDCNTYIQAIAYDTGPAAQAARLAEAGAFELFIDRLTLAELRRVCAYPQVHAISPSMTPDRINRFIDRITYRSTRLRKVPHVFEFPRDPKDEPYIDLAIAAKADYLVSRDNDLLSLMTGHDLVSKRFRRVAHRLRVLNPSQFLDALEHLRKGTP
jgi:putative PIN family toxin of toxin-antitoxin system